MTKQLVLFSPSCRQAQDARHDGRCGREGQDVCSSTSPLCMTVTCPVFVLPRCPGLWFFWEMISGMVSVCFFSVRQWLHVWRLSTAAYGRLSYFLRDGWIALEIWTLFQQAALMMSWMVFCRILRHFSHSVRMDVSAHFSALDDEEFFVVEGSGWRGRRESDSQVFCHSN